MLLRRHQRAQALRGGAGSGVERSGNGESSAPQGANAELQRLAITDRTTGVRNRAYFEEAVAAEIAGVARYGTPVSLLLLDIDHSKAINDTHGHLGGDQILIELTVPIDRHLG
nr:GGDEF domain-containing protein [Thiocapsa imhoffii]